MRKKDSIKTLPRKGDDGSRAENVKRIVYDRALDLFDRKGYRATSMNEIAMACGVSKPAIYHYFQNKSNLLETLYEDITADFYTVMKELAHSTGSATERLATFIEQHTRYNIEHKRFLTIFWRERHELDRASRYALATRERDFETWVSHIIEEGQSTGEFLPIPLKIATFSVLGLLSTVHRWADHSKSSPDEIAEAVKSMVINSLSNAAPAQKAAPVSKTTAARKTGGTARTRKAPKAA